MPDDLVGDAAEVVLVGSRREVSTLVTHVDEVDVLLVSPGHQGISNNIAGLPAWITVQYLDLDVFVGIQLLQLAETLFDNVLRV